MNPVLGMGAEQLPDFTTAAIAPTYSQIGATIFC